MAITPLSGLVADWYTPEQDGDDAGKTRFKIKPLDGLQYYELQTITRIVQVDKVGNMLPNIEAVRLSLNYGLVDWENLNDANGEPIAYSADNVGLLPSDVLYALANEIAARSALSEDQKKT